MQFEYMFQNIPLGFVDIDNIGDVSMRAVDALGDEYYLYIRTTLGQTHIISLGPVTHLPSFMQYFGKITSKKFQFNRDKIIKEIDMFLNNSKTNISNVCQISHKQFFDCLYNYTHEMEGDEADD